MNRTMTLIRLPFNLIVTDDNENQSKGAKGPSEYMPPLVSYHCEHVIHWRLLLLSTRCRSDYCNPKRMLLRSCNIIFFIIANIGRNQHNTKKI